MKHTEQDYLEIDPLYGDFDVNISNRLQKIVKCRKPHVCWGECGKQIEAGERAVNLSGFEDGEPISFYYCFSCLDSWLDELDGNDDSSEDDE